MKIFIISRPMVKTLTFINQLVGNLHSPDINKLSFGEF
uniref:Uncharacterized protein n=1 Tax=Rhizophora mucronata TaxID=61149 RepID=A0A2P2NFQ2_RHIMU